jgi:hypothetical protein
MERPRPCAVEAHVGRSRTLTLPPATNVKLHRARRRHLPKEQPLGVAASMKLHCTRQWYHGNGNPLAQVEKLRPVQVRQQFSAVSGSERASQHRRTAEAPLATARGTEKARPL